jgi:glycine/D-amino acid oxidase-like deaminating enzyme
MDLVSDHPLWPALDGAGRRYAPLRGDARADVAVIGGGVTGALVAHALSAEGLDTIVVDKREIGGGSTAASTALLQYELDVPLTELREQRGREWADRSYLACRDAIDALAVKASTLSGDVGFRRRRSLYLLSDERDTDAHRAELAARREIGLDAQWLGRDDLQRCYGIDRPGAIEATEAAEVDPYALTHALLRDASGRGARVHAHTRVERIDAREDGVHVKLEDGGTISARHAVFATGYETRELARVDDAKLVSTFALASEPHTAPSPWREHGALIWERADPYLYLRTTADDRVIVGGEDEDFRDPEHRDALLAAKVARLQERYRNLFPSATLDVAFAWAGTFGQTEDGLPYIGAHDDWPSCHFALGYGGNGTVFSVIAAEIVRDAIVGRANALADLFGFAR